jgi:hypothetical protein
MNLKPLILIAVLTLPACAAVDTAASGVKRYCAAFTWQERQVIRERVNEQVAPHRIAIDCAVMPK